MTLKQVMQYLSLLVQVNTLTGYYSLVVYSNSSQGISRFYREIKPVALPGIDEVSRGAIAPDRLIQKLRIC